MTLALLVPGVRMGGGRRTGSIPTPVGGGFISEMGSGGGGGGVHYHIADSRYDHTAKTPQHRRKHSADRLRQMEDLALALGLPEGLIDEP